MPAAAMSSSQDSERREAPLHPFIASAEETDLASGARLSARVSDLSLKGCYLDTLNPFPKGTRIRLVIFYGGETFTALATVIYPPAQHGSGHRYRRDFSMVTHSLLAGFPHSSTRTTSCRPTANFVLSMRWQ